MTIYANNSFYSRREELNLALMSTANTFATKYGWCFSSEIMLRETDGETLDIADKLMMHGMNIWPEAAAEEGDPIKSLPKIMPVFGLWRITMTVAAMIAGLITLVIMDAGPLWSQSKREAIYLRNPPKLVERVVIDIDGTVWVKVFTHNGSNALINRVVSERQISVNQIEYESSQIRIGSSLTANLGR